MDREFLQLRDENTGMQTIKDYLNDFNDKRNWTRNKRPMNVAQSIMIEAAELLEIFQWSDTDDMLDDDERKTHCADEMADVFIYILNLANALDIDLTKATVNKINKNESRFPVEETMGNW